MSNLTAIQYSTVDGSNGISQEIVINHYDLWEIHTRIDNFMSSSHKTIMESLTHSAHEDDRPTYVTNHNRAEYTSYYKYHTFTVYVSHLINSSEKTPLKISLSVKSNSNEETMETRREMNAIRYRSFNHLRNMIIDHGEELTEIYYEELGDYDDEHAFDRYYAHDE
jgi:hypothetical protein